MTLATDPLYRPTEAAKYTRTGRSTLYQAVARGDLEAPTPVGLRSVAWRESQLLRYIEKMNNRPRVKPVAALAAANARRERIKKEQAAA